MNGLTIRYSGGTTNAAAAIRTMRNNLFDVDRGDRRDVTNIGVVILDGRSNNEDETWDEAILARDEGITMLAIGVGSRSVGQASPIHFLSEAINNIMIFICRSAAALRTLSWEALLVTQLQPMSSKLTHLTTSLILNKIFWKPSATVGYFWKITCFFNLKVP